MGEGEVCIDMDAVVSDNVSENNKNSPRNELKRDHECIANGNEKEGLYGVSVKKQVKDALNEDTRSEVSDPVVSPPKINGLAVGCTPSKSAELVSEVPVGIACNEVTSKCLENLSNEENDETLSHEENSAGCTDLESNGRNDIPDSSLASHIVLEIPKDVSTTGIRKITFKFNKKKDDHGGQRACNDTGSGLKYGNLKEESEQDCLMLDLGRNSQFCAPNMELKMSKKVVHANYLTNVKKLLSTGILDGAPVKYISPTQLELSGMIAGGGYLCGCSSCNFSRVLTAYEFEQHAGCKTKHPNNHIFLENGRPIYSIIQELKTAPAGILEEVIKDAAGSAINEEFFQMWKENLVRIEMRDESEEARQYRSNLSNLPHSYSSYPSQSLGDVKRLPQFFPVEENPLNYVDTVEKQKRATKKPSSCDYYSFVKQRKASDGRSKRRDNDLHKLVFMPNGLSDGAELAYFVKGQRILGGYKQGNGIVCNCCHKEISPSQFEAHAGMSVRRQPYKHIYTSNGLSLHDIAISLLNGNSIATGGSDDMCTLCGEGGNLILCAECPRAFHTACLGLLSIPESSWCCSSCNDKPVPARKVTAGDSAPSKSIVLRLKRVVKMPEFEIGGCAICRDHDFSVGAFDERTVLLCDQCEKEFHVGCLRENGLCDLKEIPKDKWFCCDGCEKIFMALQESVSNGLEMVSLLSLHTINRKHIEKGLLVGSAGNDVQWRILSGKSRCPEDLPFLSKATAIFRECFDPIVAQSGRDLIPVMVYGRNISGQEFGGMYCVVLMARSVVVSAGLLRIFGREVAELPLVATAREHQGKGYFQALFCCIEGLLCSLNVEKLVLPAAEEAESIWTRRFGFKRMTEEQLKKRMREVQLTIFKGTSMLEKDIRR